MEDQVEFLFRISQPSDIHPSNSHLESRSGGGGGPNLQSESGADGKFWDELGLKCYGSHYDRHGVRYLSDTAEGGGSTGSLSSSPSLLQIVNILRLTIDCPDPEVAAEAGGVLKQLQVGLQIFGYN